MTDRVIISRLAVFAHHGVFAEEAKLGQRFYISLECCGDLSAAGRTDDLTQSFNYGAIADQVVEIATGRRFQLLEALAETIASEVLAHYPAMESITVRVEKPSAPVTHVLETVMVEIERSRDG